MIRPIFRVTAGILGIAFLAMAALTLIKDATSPGGLSTQTEWRGALWLVSWGVIFVFIAARGYMKR
jgi:hypothetical protein